MLLSPHGQPSCMSASRAALVAWKTSIQWSQIHHHCQPPIIARSARVPSLCELRRGGPEAVEPISIVVGICTKMLERVIMTVSPGRGIKVKTTAGAVSYMPGQAIPVVMVKIFNTGRPQRVDGVHILLSDSGLVIDPMSDNPLPQFVNETQNCKVTFSINGIVPKLKELREHGSTIEPTGIRLRLASGREIKVQNRGTKRLLRSLLLS